MEKHLPYEPLGSQLKSLREDSRESVAEVSGAVEIEEKDLAKIESGVERPTEDILLLLISHFGIQDDKAAELWQLAGYDREHDHDHDHDDRSDDASQAARNTMMIMIDPRVMYSDQVEIVANKQGVVMNFAQVGGQNGQPLTVGRIGMSQQQAKIVMGLLHQALYEIENSTKRLDDGSSK